MYRYVGVDLNIVKVLRDGFGVSPVDEMAIRMILTD